jgi:hypothetical protein
LDLRELDLSEADTDDGDDPTSETSADWPGGGLRIGADGCLFTTGEVNAGYEFTRRSGRSARFIGPRALPGTISTVIGSVSFAHLSRIGASPLVTRLSIDADADNNVTLTDASITFGPVLAGLSASAFDMWSGDEFSFRALASSQSPMVLAARVLDRPDAAIVVSLEDPSFRRVTLGGYGGLTVPDLVVRGTWRRGPMQLVVAAAGRETRLSGGGALHGHAVQVSATFGLPALADESYLIAQAAYADNALGYLGINTRTNTLGIVLPGILDAARAERGHGSSAALVLVHQIASDWRLAAFTSASRIMLDRDCGGCEVRSMRSAVNLTWMPQPGFDIALEAGAAITRSSIPVLLPGRNWSTILSVSRTF